MYHKTTLYVKGMKHARCESSFVVQQSQVFIEGVSIDDVEAPFKKEEETRPIEDGEHAQQARVSGELMKGAC